MPLPEPDWIPLSQAADRVAERCNCSIEAARHSLVQTGLREGHIKSRCVAQVGFNDPDPLRVCWIPPEEWVRLGINWASNSLGFAPNWSGGLILAEVYRPHLDHWIARAEFKSIVVPPGPVHAPLTATKAELEAAYIKRRDEWPNDKSTPSEKDDWNFLKTLKPDISRDRARELRNKLAPDDWKQPGKRKIRG
jgi:hypothetical protein